MLPLFVTLDVVTPDGRVELSGPKNHSIVGRNKPDLISMLAEHSREKLSPAVGVGSEGEMVSLLTTTVHNFNVDMWLVNLKCSAHNTIF